MSTRLTAAAALAAHGTAAFDDEDGDGGKCSNGVCPSHVENAVQDKSGESDKGKVGAGGRLNRISSESIIPGSAGEFALLPCEQRHDEQRRHGNSYPERAHLGMNFPSQGQDGCESDYGGKDEEQGSGGAVDPLAGEAGSERHHDQQSGEQFYEAVESKGEER